MGAIQLDLCEVHTVLPLQCIILLVLRMRRYVIHCQNGLVEECNKKKILVELVNAQ
jgi:hypothetical protein